MSTRLLPRPLGYVLAAIVLALSLLVLGSHSLTTVQAAGDTYVVNSTVDLPDANPGDDICLALNSQCTLRAADSSVRRDESLPASRATTTDDARADIEGGGYA